MSTNNLIRTNTGGKILNSVSKAGTTFHDAGPPPGNNLLPEIVNSTPYSNYIDTVTGDMYQKDENGDWGSDFIKVGPGQLGGITGLEPSGTGFSLIPSPDVSVGNKGRVLSLTSIDGTILFTSNGESLDIEVAGLERNNFTATRGPNFNDNLSDGYAVGSVWINTGLDSGKKSFTCVRSSLTSAIWKPTSNELTFQQDVPSNIQDKNFGYLEGSVIWTPDGQYINIDDNFNVAKWALFGGKEGEDKWTIRRENEQNPNLNESYDHQFKNDGNTLRIKNDFSGTLPVPGINTDSSLGQGWSIGSRIKDNDNGFLWDCLDASVGAASWSCDMAIGGVSVSQITNQWNDGDIVSWATNVNSGSYADVVAFANNWLATTNPTAAEGNDNGYIIGSMWRNSTTNEVFVYDNFNWNSITSPIVSTKAVAHYGFKYISGVGTRPTYNSPQLTGIIVVPLRLGGAPGVNTTWAPLAGHDLSSLFENANANSENLALQYTGTVPGWYTVDLYLKAQKASPGPTTNWIIQLWSDTVSNAQTLSFNRTDPQVENEEETETYTFSLSSQSVTFLRYFTPGEFIGVGVRPEAESGFWTTLIDNISIKLSPA
jgi:hypothetical protein